MGYICVKQHDTTDCAAACIATISKHYGLKLPIMKIRRAATTDRQGTNLLGVKKAVEELGFEMKAYRAEAKDLTSKLNFPFIAHTHKGGLLHYVVVHAIKRGKLIVADPAKGIIKYSIKEFNEFWSGVVVFLNPTESFRKGNETDGLFSRFFHIIKPHMVLVSHVALASILITVFGLVGTYYYRFLIDDILANFLKNSLVVFTIGMIMVSFFKIALTSFRSYMMIYLGQVINTDLILKYYQHVISLPMNFFETRKTGEIISRLSDAGKIVSSISGVTLTLMIDVLMVCVAGGLLANQNLKMFMLALVFIPLHLVLAVVFVKPFQKRHREEMENYAQIESYLVESINGVAGIKSLNAEEETNYKLEENFIKGVKSSFKTDFLGIVSGTLEGIVSNLSSYVILFIGGMEVINGNLSVGQLISFNALFSYFFNPIQNLIDIIPSIQEAYIASERLGDILELEAEKAKDKDKVELKRIKGNIEVRNLNFQYGTREQVLYDLNFEIKAGEKIAIVGESGSGKSTLIKLLMKYYEVKDGEILIDGHHLDDIGIESLRKKIAYVSQDVFLYSGTIKENLEFGFEEKEMSELIKACKMAEAHEFISKMSLRYNSLIGENGSTLSGGQKQRLALARAIVQDADMLIFDEATSSLDTKTEKKIQKTIDKVCRDKTTIIIAHRLSTIMNCDRIIVLDKGKVKEIGSHRELLEKKDGVYRKYWEAQAGIS